MEHDDNADTEMIENLTRSPTVIAGDLRSPAFAGISGSFAMIANTKVYLECWQYIIISVLKMPIGYSNFTKSVVNDRVVNSWEKGN